ncbi:site-specific integrase [Phocaeicola sp.]
MEKNTKAKRSTFAVLFYLNTSKRKKDGTCPIVGRITVDANSVQFSTKISLSSLDWDAKKGRAKKERKELTEINRTLDRLEKQVKAHYSRIAETEGYVTAERVKNALNGVGEKASNLLQLFQEHNTEFEKRVGVNRVYDTYYSYLLTYKHLSDFIRMKYNSDDVSLISLTHKFIDDFDFYLRVEKRMQASTVLGHMISLKKIITRAINQGTLRRNPFMNYVAEQPLKKYRHLTEEEFQKILTTPIASPRYSHTRDWFVFSTFTGLSYADMCALSVDNLVTEQDGSIWLKIPRRKTGTVCNIKLLSIPLMIIEKYRDERKTDKVFNMISLSNICINLKEIAKLCGIGRNLTYHMSRHTYATQTCLLQGVPIETVSKLMGHRSIQTTQIYAKITNQKVSEDMKKLFTKVSGKYQVVESDITAEMAHKKFPHWKKINQIFPDKK